MSTKRKTVIGGVVGVIVAIGLIVAGAYAFGGLSINGSTSSINTLTSEQSISTTTSAGVSSGASTSNSNGGSSGSTGTLQISMIDPPNVPANVIDVYINYTGIQIHVSNSSTNSGWLQVTSKGTLNLTNIVANPTILSTVSVTSGTYNIIRFNVTSAVVTVNDSNVLTNHTANVPAGMIQSVITGGVKVQANNPAGLLVDISPTVHDVNGSYTLLPSATAHPQTPVGHDPAVSTNVTKSNHATSVSKPAPTDPTTTTTTSASQAT